MYRWRYQAHTIKRYARRHRIGSYQRLTDVGPARFYSPSLGCVGCGVTLKFTDDGGKTWSQPQAAFPHEAQDWGINAVRWISEAELIAAGDHGTLSKLAVKNGQVTIVWNV